MVNTGYSNGNYFFMMVVDVTNHDTNLCYQPWYQLWARFNTTHTSCSGGTRWYSLLVASCLWKNLGKMVHDDCYLWLYSGENATSIWKTRMISSTASLNIFQVILYLTKSGKRLQCCVWHGFNSSSVYPAWSVLQGSQNGWSDSH